MKKKTKKLVLAKETLRSMDLVVGGLTDTACYTCGTTCYTCGNTCTCNTGGGSRLIACFNTQQGSCTC